MASPPREPPAAPAQGGERDEAGSPPAPDRMPRVVGVWGTMLNVMAAFAAPRVLVKLPAEQLVEMTQERVIGLFDEYVETFMGAERAETSSGGKGDPTVEPLQRARALLEQWPIASQAPAPLIQAARDFLNACGLPDPKGGWDAWEGPGDEPDTRPELPSPRALRPEPMTIDEWTSWRGPGELVDGVLVEEEAATPLHDAVVARLLAVFSAWASSHGARAFGPDHKLVVSESGGRKPDICVYVASDRLERDGASSRRPPSLVVEVLSPGKIDERRDLVTKAREYAKLGVRFYWRVDPLARQIGCTERLPDERWLVTWIATDGSFAVSDFEDLVLDLDSLWAEVAGP